MALPPQIYAAGRVRQTAWSAAIAEESCTWASTSACLLQWPCWSRPELPVRATLVWSAATAMANVDCMPCFTPSTPFSLHDVQAQQPAALLQFQLPCGKSQFVAVLSADTAAAQVPALLTACSSSLHLHPGMNSCHGHARHCAVGSTGGSSWPPCSNGSLPCMP